MVDTPQLHHFYFAKKIPPLFFFTKNQVYFGPKSVLLALLSIQLALFGPFLTLFDAKIPFLPLPVKTAKLCSSIFFTPLLRAGLVILDQSFSEIKILYMFGSPKMIKPKPCNDSSHGSLILAEFKLTFEFVSRNSRSTMSNVS